MQRECAYNLKLNFRSKMRSDEKSNISTKVEKGLSIDPSKQKDEIKVEEVASNPTLDEVENVKQLIKSIKRFQDFFSFYAKFLEVQIKMKPDELKNSTDKAKNTILIKCEVVKNTIAEWLKTNTNPKICEEFLVKLESDPNCEVNIMKALENVHCEEFVGDVLVKSQKQ